MSVMFIEATPGDRLLKMLKQTEETHKISDNHRIKIVTKAGTKLKHLLERKDPFMSKCSDNDCQPCENSKDTHKVIDCRKNMICYEAKCKTCGNEGKLRTYHGETARNLYTRSKEHYSALRNQDEKSFMNKHIVKEHGGKPDEVEFDWKIIGKFKKPLSRQLTEAIRIDKKSKDDNLNSKNEYFRHTVKRISLSNSDSKEECGYCGKKLKILMTYRYMRKTSILSKSVQAAIMSPMDKKVSHII